METSEGGEGLGSMGMIVLYLVGAALTDTHFVSCTGLRGSGRVIAVAGGF